MNEFKPDIVNFVSIVFPMRHPSDTPLAPNTGLPPAQLS
jgi:hypothetical protein